MARTTLSWIEKKDFVSRAESRHREPRTLTSLIDKHLDDVPLEEMSSNSSRQGNGGEVKKGYLSFCPLRGKQG